MGQTLDVNGPWSEISSRFSALFNWRRAQFRARMTRPGALKSYQVTASGLRPKSFAIRSIVWPFVDAATGRFRCSCA